MLSRILSYLVFIVVMTVIAAFSLVFVVVIYWPFVALKALWLTANGRIHEAVGPKKADASKAAGEAG